MQEALDYGVICYWSPSEVLVVTVSYPENKYKYLHRNWLADKSSEVCHSLTLNLSDASTKHVL